MKRLELNKMQTRANAKLNKWAHQNKLRVISFNKTYNRCPELKNFRLLTFTCDWKLLQPVYLRNCTIILDNVKLVAWKNKKAQTKLWYDYYHCNFLTHTIHNSEECVTIPSSYCKYPMNPNCHIFSKNY